MRIESITRENLDDYKGMILPYIYDEFTGNGAELDTEFMGLSAVLDESDEGYDDAMKATGSVACASVLVVQPEAEGDLNIVSIFTLPALRRRGYASALMDKALFIARKMFIWDEEENESLILFKTLYRIPDDIREVYEEFLMKNNFTDFIQVETADNIPDDGLCLDVWSASAEVKFYR
ncbi:GNAT family N-acetyltransferase [Butyrivibrio sp. VCD2006]|uniref:GNAT family N-acetyltransferase n=1 Tax=Butyrivibrio sp. VCD2006 TaxID=1280664 RepID=UPI00041CEDC5|nr:GNAT family N-acetyltransferase [Butyrivibrio sp. VCD2006]